MFARGEGNLSVQEISEPFPHEPVEAGRAEAPRAQFFEGGPAEEIGQDGISDEYQTLLFGRLVHAAPKQESQAEDEPDRQKPANCSCNPSFSDQV
jgi:hypothetical protein